MFTLGVQHRKIEKARRISRVSDMKHVNVPPLREARNAIGASKSGSLLGLLHRHERDSRIFTNAEIIFDDFRSKDTLPLNNRGQTFVSLSGFLEILSKTELSSDKIDDFQEETFSDCKIFQRRILRHFAVCDSADLAESERV